MKYFIRITAYILVLMLTVTGLGLTAFAGEPFERVSITDFAKTETVSSKARYKAEDTVRFIVTLEEDCVVDTMSEGTRLNEYYGTFDGQNAIDEVAFSQERVFSQIKSMIPDVQLIEDFSVAINAIVIETEYSWLEALKRLSGVKGVRVAEKVELNSGTAVPYTLDGIASSGEMMQKNEVYEDGYTGKGSVVAVIDSALDVSHEAFLTEPVGASMTASDVKEAVESGLLNAQADHESLYKSSKIPFAYDYFNSDTDVSAPETNTHGTHVSGSAVGNSDSFKGTAPDAQLVFMKIFDDAYGNTDEIYIYTALEDCAVLGVDVVNLSLGSGAGFTDCGEYETFLENCAKVGTYIVCAAGNDGDQAYNISSIGRYPLVSQPDSGLVSEPSTSLSALSVASAERIRDKKVLHLLAGENKLLYSDFNAGTDMAFEEVFNGRTLEYEVISGVGRAEELEGVDLTGKVALIKRGEISFSEKENNAVAAGAVGVIFYNVDDELLRVSSTNAVPNILITNSDGLLLIEREEKNIYVSRDSFDTVPVENGGQMSVTSGMGVAPDMTLKPEITAAGGGEYSTLPGGLYGEMSGTSMAVPQIVGAVAVLKQYYRDYLELLPVEEHNEFISTVLMNTASIIHDPNGVPYTPRKQGSGFAQMGNAVNTDCYVAVEGNSRPVAQLGSSIDGTYTATLTVTNLSDRDKQYKLSAIALVPELKTVEGFSGESYDCMHSDSRVLSQDEFTVTFSEDTVTAEAGQSVSVTATLKLTEKGKQSVSGFVNGIYMEGYIILEDTDDEGVDLHVTYMGFYGDWSSLAIYDKTIYDSEPPTIFTSYFALLNSYGGGNILGMNNYTFEELIDKNKIAFNYKSIDEGLMPTVELSTLRGARSIVFEVFDEDGNSVELFDPNTLESIGNKHLSEYVKKTINDGAIGMLCYYSRQWLPIKAEGEGTAYLEDGEYTVRFTAMPDGTQDSSYAQIMEFPVTIDNEYPEIISHKVYEENGERFLTVLCTDDHYLAASMLVNEAASEVYCGPVVINEEEAGAVSEVTFNVTELLAEGREGVSVMLIDYAENEYVSETIDITELYETPRAVYFVKDSFECAGEAEITLELYAEPVDALCELTWESDNEAVATVTAANTTRTDSESGKVLYLAQVKVNNVDGTATISAATRNGRTATAVIHVRKAAELDELTALLDVVRALDEMEYTASSWKRLQIEYTAAELLAENAEAEQETVDAVTAAVRNAVAALVRAGDTTALKELIGEAETSLSEYTKEDRKKILDCVETARTVIEERAEQERVDAALNGLMQVLNTAEKGDGDKKPVHDGSAVSSQTGDISFILLITLMAVSGSIILLLCTRRVKKKHCKRN